MLRTIFNRRRKRRQQHDAGTFKSRTFGVESLEARQMMAADVSYMNGVLSIEGTDKADTILIERGLNQSPKFQLFTLDASVRDSSGRVVAFGSYSSVSYQTRIEVQGLGGDDNIQNTTLYPSIIDAGPGNDFVFSGRGSDLVYGGDGNDTIRGYEGDDVIYGQDGHDRLDGWHGNDTVVGGDGNDNVTGWHGNDTLDGGAGDDVVRGGYGDDDINGALGDDALYGDDGNDAISGSIGRDTIYGGTGDDEIFGGWGSDKIFGNVGDDRIDGGWQNDEIDAGPGFDYVLGGRGDDDLRGGSGDDTLFGGDGDDYLHGAQGKDALFGENGDDDLYGGDQSDSLFGGDGRDGLYGGSGTDVLFSGSGVDRILDDDNDNYFMGEEDVTVHFDAGEDESIIFEGKTIHFSGANWKPQDVETVDLALRSLHHRAKHGELLQRADGSDITFVRLGAPNTPTLVSGWNDQSKIYLPDATFERSTAREDWAVQTVFHEVGHFWDDENPMWNSFQAISDWTQSGSQPSSMHVMGLDASNTWWHIDDGEYAREYGRTNPQEDFSTAFAAYFMDLQDRSFIGNMALNASTTGAAAVPSKIAFIDAFVSGF